MVKTLRTQPVKVVCPTCMGYGTLDDIEYETEREVKLLCPGCDGAKYIIGYEVMEE